ncbi:hypothetical protein RUM43_014884 [Polyplax serrata]|uniref:Uncharacterized protein n=1 Tax=Polyplax serrata TaxID=468196 RepID=A0AAN8P4D1_POLSC
MDGWREGKSPCARASGHWTTMATTVKKIKGGKEGRSGMCHGGLGIAWGFVWDLPGSSAICDKTWDGMERAHHLNL